MTRAEFKLLDNAEKDRAVFIEKAYPSFNYKNCRYVLYTSDNESNIKRAYIVTRNGMYPVLDALKFKKFKIKDIY